MTVASATVSVRFALVTFSAGQVALLSEMFETVEVVASVALFSIFAESTTASEAFTKTSEAFTMASEAFTMASEAFTMTSVLETFTTELPVEVLKEFEVSEVSVEVLDEALEELQVQLFKAEEVLVFQAVEEVLVFQAGSLALLAFEGFSLAFEAAPEFCLTFSVFSMGIDEILLVIGMEFQGLRGIHMQSGAVEQVLALCSTLHLHVQ